MAAVEGMYQTSREADELRSDCSYLLRNLCPSKFSISVQEHRAIKELGEHLSRVVLTADKGVALVVMDKQDYMDKALSLLTDTNTYRTINKDPTTKLKNQLICTLKDIKQTGELIDLRYRKVYSSFMAFPKFIRWALLSDPLCSVGIPSPMGWQRYWQASCAPWFTNLLTTSKIDNTLWNI